MNHSNRYGVERMARRNQAKIEKQLRQYAEMRILQSSPTVRIPKHRWIAVAAAALSIVGAIASVVVVHAR